MLFRLGSILASVSLISLVQAKGQVAQVVDSTNFCIFLPPTDSTDRNISDTEWDANAFCMGNTPKATGADQLPSGFITSAHYVATDDYVQVTGQMDPAKANLNTTDEGGQYDIKAPNGSSCAGWSYYVNLIEPINSIYCIRCCNDTTNCNRGISQDGCRRVVPGDYSGPSGGSAPTANPTTTTAASSPTSTAASSTTTVSPSSTTASTGAASSGNVNGGSSASGSGTNPPASASSGLPVVSSGTSVTSSVTVTASSSQSAITGTPADPNAGSTSPSKSGAAGDESVSAQSVNGKNGASIVSPGLLTLGAVLISLKWLA
ncbi:hypothetical protein EC973_002042 [Apophysomyces ossiformis]|uniref:Secreted protein n=1 Tax=Apophysomyces ossiformis TaxID=679940 RepID=A0A8H7EMT5_9FUNG|nr:hypothetical protein EC973_002042 [Apophysomyces ossiformis]